MPVAATESLVEEELWYEARLAGAPAGPADGMPLDVGPCARSDPRPPGSVRTCAVPVCRAALAGGNRVCREGRHVRDS